MNVPSFLHREDSLNLSKSQYSFLMTCINVRPVETQIVKLTNLGEFMKRVVLVLTLSLLVSSSTGFGAAEKWDISGLEGKYPFEIAADYKVVSTIGKLATDNFQLAFNSGSEAVIVGGRYLIASGCMPGVCAVLDKLIVIDSQTPDGIAVFSPVSDFRDSLKRVIHRQASDSFLVANGLEYTDWPAAVVQAIHAWAARIE